MHKIIVENIPEGFAETMNWKMICFEVSLKTYPKTYNKKPLMNVALAAQKNYNSLYLMSVSTDNILLAELKKWFEDANLTMNMGTSCIIFKKLEDLPLDIISSLISKVSLQYFICKLRKS